MMNQIEIVNELLRSANENGLLPTLDCVFGKNINISIAFSQRACDTISNSDLENQIHIPIGYDIFNFEFKQIEEHKLPEHFNVFDAMTGASKK